MNTTTLHLWKAASLIGGVALAAAACGSGGNTSTASGALNASPGGGSNGAIVSTASVDGTRTLASADGHTLYAASGESSHHILCTDACTSFWKPLMASTQQARQATATLNKDFTAVSRPDGGTQLAYAGHPLYTFAQEGAHELRGNGFADDFQGTHFTWSAAGTNGATETARHMGSRDSSDAPGEYGSGGNDGY
jgi:predicted lipoprotein with Yx(FWY)xxD motif